MFKKIALVVLFLGVTVGFAYLLYRFFFGTPTVTPPPPTGNEVTVPGGGGLPTSGEGRPTAPTPGGTPTPGGITPSATISRVANGGLTETETVSNQQAKGLHGTSTGNVAYYDARTGKFFQVLPSGTVQALSSQSFPEAESIEWTPRGDKVLVTFPDASKVIYDFATQNQITLPKHWEDIAFTADGSEIVAKSMGLDPENRWLVSATTDGKSETLLEPLGENGDKVTISVSPDASVVAFSQTSDPVGFDTKDLLLIGQHHENFPALRIEGFDFTPEWSPTGKRLLYSAAGGNEDYAPVLWLVNGSTGTVGGNRQNLGVRTWADKCVFKGDDTAYCAVPESLPQGAGLERDIADTIPDNVVKIDFLSGTTSLIGRPAEATSMSSLVLSADGSKLFFTTPTGEVKDIRLR